MKIVETFSLFVDFSLNLHNGNGVSRHGQCAHKPQEPATGDAKGRIPQCERPQTGLQKVVFYGAKGHGLQRRA